MALEPPRTQIEEGGQEPPPPRAARPLWQAVVLFGGGLVVFFVVVAFALRTWVVPAMSGASSQPSAAQATLAALQTQEAVRPVATAVVATVPAPTPAPATAPVVVATAALTIPPAATAAPTADATGTSLATMATTVAPTVAPELAAEVSAAYLHYFQVTADAFLDLDATSLPDVAVDGELSALQQNIADFRSQARALMTNVQHNFSVVSVNGDMAQVADQYRDSSVYVDPTTHEPLPGEVTPSSPENAPLVRVVYRLQRVDGTWKVAGGTKYE